MIILRLPGLKIIKRRGRYASYGIGPWWLRSWSGGGRKPRRRNTRRR